MMRVQRVLMPEGSESWTVLDAGGEPVRAVESFLAHLQALDRSATTVRAYATSLKLWSQFLDRLGVAGRRGHGHDDRFAVPGEHVEHGDHVRAGRPATALASRRLRCRKLRGLTRR
jgi:hypothetical protein